LHLAYLEMRLGPGDEVLVPALTHVATAHAVELVGARPVFVDCTPDTGNLDIECAERLVTAHTKALSVVHFAGIPCAMDKVVEVAQLHRMRVVEDCALAVGGAFEGRHVGLFGDTGCFSFYPVKHITTGEGGMLVTRHPEVAEKARRMRAFGVDRGHLERSRPGFYEAVELGLNYRMSELHAALGRGQLGRIGDNLLRRERNFVALKTALAQNKDLRVLDTDDGRVTNSHYCLSVVLLGALSVRRDQVVARLKDAGIGTSIYYPQPVPRMPYYRNKYGYQPQAFAHAEEISDRSIALPVGPHLGPEDIEYLSSRMLEVLDEVAR
jgi:dTDP-4-amino-4,6-dideoxygalactose transaminase